MLRDFVAIVNRTMMCILYPFKIAYSYVDINKNRGQNLPRFLFIAKVGKDISHFAFFLKLLS